MRIFSVFESIVSLQSLIVTNVLRISTPRARMISRKSWTPDFFVSGKFKLLKIIKTDSVINISRPYTEIFPKTDKKKRHFLPTKDRYNSVQCVILKEKARCLKILRKTLLDFFSLDKDSNINVIKTSYYSKTPLTIFSSFKTVYRALKSVKEPSIMEKYPILPNCRTARFKIDWYIAKPETFCQLSGEMRLSIITTYFIWETSQFFTLSFHSSLWSWRIIFESGHRGHAGFRGQAGLLTALFLERLGC